LINSTFLYLVRKFSADFIFPINSPPIANGILITDDHGVVLDVLENNEGLEDVLRVPGFLCPGFINAHCHLELSHLKGLLPEKQGLVNFITPIINLRKAEKEIIEHAMREAQRTMKDNGIVAVGDICNTDDSFCLKAESAMQYHNFIEVISIDPDKAEAVFSEGVKLQDRSKMQGMTSSVVPHAPYTVSSKLLQLLSEHARRTGEPLCIHNQESEHENVLFSDGTGPIKDFYAKLGNDLKFFRATGTNSLEAVLRALGEGVSLLLVHNTYTNQADLLKAEEYNAKLSFCLCPNANLYIEQMLPDIQLLAKNDRMITLGTDSLASNWSLSILDELKTLVKSDTRFDLSTLLTWATDNGAKFLGFEDKLGTFERGKQPGVNLIYDVDLDNVMIDQASKVRVLL